MHQSLQAKMGGGAEMHLPATVTSAEMHSKNSVGKGAEKHPQAKRGGGAEMHLQSTVTGAEMHLKSSVGKSAEMHSQAKRGGGAEMHLQSTVTGAEMHLKNSVGKSDDPAKQGKLDPYIPVRSQEAKEAAPDSVRSTLLNSSHQSGWEDANADAENSITSRTTSQKTDSASNSNQSSYASTPGEKRAETSQASGSNPIQVVSERLQWLIWDWRDQIRKSNCSESIKAKDLEMIKDLVVGSFLLENFGEHQMLIVGQQTCDHLGPIREACGTDAGTSDHISSKYSMKNEILYRRIKQKDSIRMVICLPDSMLPATIHLSHGRHSSLSASRRKFERRYYNRNADRMIKSYARACNVCSSMTPFRKGGQAGSKVTKWPGTMQAEDYWREFKSHQQTKTTHSA
jgi:hypothetical protein